MKQIMTNYILISKTFATITPESAEIGDFDKIGFITECEKVSFTELVDLMIECREPSSSPNDYSTNVWYSSGFYTANYRTGEEREECLHFHRNNAPNVAKYWKLARIAADKKLNEWRKALS